MKLKFAAGILLALGGLLSASTASLAQADYPHEKTVTIIVPWPPGGSTDIILRHVAEEFQKRLGGTFIVENRPGASSGLGTGIVATAEPDGYTLLGSTNSSIVTNPLLMHDLPYDFSDIRGVASMSTGIFALMGGRTFGPQTIEDFIAAAKEAPGSISMGNNGPGTTTALVGLLIESEIGIDLLDVPFQGQAPAKVALLSGEVDTNIETVANGVSSITAGEYRALAVASAERSPALPDVPTFAEVGYPNIIGLSTNALYAPAETPDEIVKLLSDTVAEMFESKEFTDKILAIANEPTFRNNVDFDLFLQEEYDRWKPVIEGISQ